jgi:hypothetical protein
MNRCLPMKSLLGVLPLPVMVNDDRFNRGSSSGRRRGVSPRLKTWTITTRNQTISGSAMELIYRNARIAADDASIQRRRRLSGMLNFYCWEVADVNTRALEQNV